MARVGESLSNRRSALLLAMPMDVQIRHFRSWIKCEIENNVKEKLIILVPLGDTLQNYKEYIKEFSING